MMYMKSLKGYELFQKSTFSVENLSQCPTLSRNNRTSEITQDIACERPNSKYKAGLLEAFSGER